MQSLNYNIHDILKFKIIRDKGHGLRDLINLKFSFFEVDDVDNPDIILNIGKFTPSNRNCYLVDHKYYIKEKYIYCKDSEGKAEWKVEIQGFEDGKTVINFNGKIKGFQYLMNPDFLAQNFLLKIIEYKLSRKRYFLAHAAGISKDNEAYMFAGRGGSFKTTICMDFIRNAGFSFLGDDRVIIRNYRVFSFPMNLNTFGFMCRHLKDENSWSLINKVKFIRWLLSKNEDLVNVCKHSKLKALFFISRTSGEFSTKILSHEEAIHRLVMNNRLEDFIDVAFLGVKSGPFFRYMLAYSFIFPDSNIAKYLKDSKERLSNIMEKIPCYEMKIPYTYNQTVFNKIHNFIERLN